MHEADARQMDDSAIDRWRETAKQLNAYGVQAN